MKTDVVTATAHLHSKEVKQKVQPDGTQVVSLSTEDYSMFITWTLQYHSNCFMLSVNSRDKKKLNDVVTFLLENNMLTNVFSGIDSSRLFISSKRLIPLQKAIATKFNGLKFILVRLNRHSFPTQRYC